MEMKIWSTITALSCQYEAKTSAFLKLYTTTFLEEMLLSLPICCRKSDGSKKEQILPLQSKRLSLLQGPDDCTTYMRIKNEEINKNINSQPSHKIPIACSFICFQLSET